MCGIVGLLIKQPELRAALGEFVTPMLVCMGTRGPDSAGLAVFSDPVQGSRRRFSLYFRDQQFDWQQLVGMLERDTRCQAHLDATASHAAITTELSAAALKEWLARNYPLVQVLSVGRAIDVFKDEGRPHEIAERYRFEDLHGTHAVGHTRMATESAVSPAHAHPFTAGEDFCLVHNGSLSNPFSIRRSLEKRGITFETDNDTEAGCRFLGWRMSEGDTLEQAIEKAFDQLDGFFTFLMATADRMVLVRDAFGCKPAVAAETDQYIAVSSEFRGLAHLPGIQQAQVFEPVPEHIYSWTL